MWASSRTHTVGHRKGQLHTFFGGGDRAQTEFRKQASDQFSCPSNFDFNTYLAMYQSIYFHVWIIYFLALIDIIYCLVFTIIVEGLLRPRHGQSINKDLLWLGWGLARA